MADQKVIYEPHPVSKERKAELVSQGFKILDARFAPAGLAEPKPAKKTPAKRKPAAKKATVKN